MFTNDSQKTVGRRKPKCVWNRRLVLQMVRAHARSQHWITHRLMIDQHVNAIMEAPERLPPAVLESYENMVTHRRRIGKLCLAACLLIAMMTAWNRLG